MSTMSHQGQNDRFGYKMLWILRFIALLAGCLGMGLIGPISAFNAYALAVKKTFNFTQTDVDLMGSVGNVGVCFAIPAGLVNAYFGPRITSLIALILSTLGFVLMWSSTFSKTFYSRNAWLLEIHYFLASFGAVFTSMSCLSTCMDNFPPKHRGKVIGLLDAFSSVGAAITSAVYSQCYVNGHVIDAENQNLRGFWIFCAIAFGTVNALGILCLERFPYGYYETDEDSGNFTEAPSLSYYPKYNENGGLIFNEHLDNNNEKLPYNFINGIRENMTMYALLKNIDFQFLFWSVMFNGGLQLMYVTNITTYLNSFHLERWNATFVIVQPIVAAISKIISGSLSDLTVHKFPRVIVLATMNAIQTVVVIICIFKADTLTIMWMSMVAVGLSNGALWCLAPTMMSEFFGMKYFTRNWGWTLMGTALFGIGVQKIFGALYDMNVEAGTDCFGLHCFQMTFLIAATFSLSSVILNVGLFERRYKFHKTG